MHDRDHHGAGLTDLPDPPVPADLDLRGYGYMPLHGHKLFTSGYYAAALRNPRGGIAALKLWWIAWQQCPAGSLPNDERELARFADVGSDMRAWQRIRAVALHGFTLHSDGRLYHSLLVEEAWRAVEERGHARNRKRKQRDRMKDAAAETRLPRGSDAAAARLRRGSTTADQPHVTNVMPLENKETDANVTRDVTVRSRLTGRDGNLIESEIPSVSLPRPPSEAPQGALLLTLPGGGEPAPAGDPAIPLGDRVRSAQGGEARRIMRVFAPKMSDDRIGTLLGKWLRDMGGDRAALLHVLRDAETAATRERIIGEPIAWISGLVKARTQNLKEAVPNGQGPGHQHRQIRTVGGQDTDVIRRAALDAAGLARDVDGE